MKDGFCKVAAACINQARQIISVKYRFILKLRFGRALLCMRRNTTALDSIHRGTSASAHQYSQRSDFEKSPPRVRREDDQAIRDQEARVKVHFSLSAPSIYNILTGQEKYNPTVGAKLDITGQEQYISTVGNNLVQVAAQQHQPLLRFFLSTNGGDTTRTAAVNGTASRGQGTRQAAWNSIGEGSASSPVRSCYTRNEPLQTTLYIMETAQACLNDMGEIIFPPEVSQRLLALFGRTPDD